MVKSHGQNAYINGPTIYLLEAPGKGEGDPPVIYKLTVPVYCATPSFARGASGDVEFIGYIC